MAENVAPVLAVPDPSVDLTVGCQAPLFDLPDQNNQRVTLAQFRDLKRLVVVFFPLAFTGNCEGELGDIRDNLPDFENETSSLIAISVGAPPTHKVWSSMQGFLFPILSDFWPHGDVAARYGAFNHRAGYATRSTFVVDTDGTVLLADSVGPGQVRGNEVWDRVRETLAQ